MSSQTDSPNNSQSPTTTSTSARAASIYDVVILAATSLGKAFPLILILIILGGGVWLILLQWNLSNDRLLDLQTKAFEAKERLGETNRKADNVHLERENKQLEAQARKLIELNEFAARLSSQAQALVATQLANSAKLEEQMATQTSRQEKEAKARITGLEDELKKTEITLRKKLDSMNGEIFAATKIRDKALADSEIAVYLGVRELLINEIDKDYPSGYRSLVEIMQKQMRSEAVFARASLDSEEQTIHWKVRSSLLIQLFYISDEKKHLDNLLSLLTINATQVDSAVIKLFDNLFTFKTSQIPVVVPFYLMLGTNENILATHREELLNFIHHLQQSNKSRVVIYFQKLTDTQRLDLGRSVVKLFSHSSINTKGGFCKPRLDFLELLSLHAAAAYGNYVLSKVSPTGEMGSCIRAELRSRYGGASAIPFPTDLQKWLASTDI